MTAYRYLALAELLMPLVLTVAAVVARAAA